MEEFPRHGTIFVADEEIYDNIVIFLEDTEKEVIILSPWIDSTAHMKDRIKVMRKKGVEITLLTRTPKDNKHRQAVEELQKVGVEVFYDDRLHGKMLLFDRDLVMVMSSNIILSSMVHNHEAGMVSTNPEVVENAIRYLQYLEDVLEHPIMSRFDKLFPKKRVRTLVLDKFFGKLIKKEEREEEPEPEKECPLCQKPLIYREGSYGKFWGCSGYTSNGCLFTRNIEDLRNREN